MSNPYQPSRLIPDNTSVSNFPLPPAPNHNHYPVSSLTPIYPGLYGATSQLTPTYGAYPNRYSAESLSNAVSEQQRRYGYSALYGYVEPGKEEFPPEVTLGHTELWNKFNRAGTEMIITKAGRRMFPVMKVNIKRLDPNAKYVMAMDMIPVDDNRYKYHDNQWIITGKAEPQLRNFPYIHPDSPATGSQWMKQGFSFHKMKLTNNPVAPNGQLLLNSMHKYRPRLHVFRYSENTDFQWRSVNTFTFDRTDFIAVTAYQNEEVTQLKINFNPFAKGFREGNHSRRKDRACKRDNQGRTIMNDATQPLREENLAMHEDNNHPPLKRARPSDHRDPVKSAVGCSNAQRPSLNNQVSHVDLFQQLSTSNGLIDSNNDSTGIEPSKYIENNDPGGMSMASGSLLDPGGSLKMEPSLMNLPFQQLMGGIGSLGCMGGSSRSTQFDPQQYNIPGMTNQDYSMMAAAAAMRSYYQPSLGQSTPSSGGQEGGGGGGGGRGSGSQSLTNVPSPPTISFTPGLATNFYGYQLNPFYPPHTAGSGRWVYE